MIHPYRLLSQEAPFQNLSFHHREWSDNEPCYLQVNHQFWCFMMLTDSLLIASQFFSLYSIELLHYNHYSANCGSLIFLHNRFVTSNATCIASCSTKLCRFLHLQTLIRILCFQQICHGQSHLLLLKHVRNVRPLQLLEDRKVHFHSYHRHMQSILPPTIHYNILTHIYIFPENSEPLLHNRHRRKLLKSILSLPYSIH